MLPAFSDRSGCSPTGPAGLGPAAPGRRTGCVRRGAAVATVAVPPIELTRVGKWIERVPTLRLDGAEPTSRAVAARIAAFWIPSTTVLYVGTSSTSIAGRVAAIEATTLGDRRPHSGGHWLKLLTGLERARVWWARTDATEEYEDALYAAFAEGVPAADRALLHDHDVVLPFANLRSTAGDRKAHGLTAYLVPDDAQPQRKVAMRVTELPAGDADGASGLPPTRAAGGMTRRAPRAKAVAPAAPARRPARRPRRRRLLRRPVRRTSPPRGSLGSAGSCPAATTVRRPEVIARIKSAKELGDLKENALHRRARGAVVSGGADESDDRRD